MRTPATRFEDLVVWQKAHQFVLAAYRLSRTLPRSETYGLSSQFRRAAVSIAANIAEGFKKRNYSGSRKSEFRSQNEYGDVSGSSQLLEEVSKLLEAYSRAILNSDSCILPT